MTARTMLLIAVALAGPVSRISAQDPAQVEAVAPLLMAEDRRAFDITVFTRGVNDPDPLVRRTAILGIGRIGDHRGTPLLLQALNDRDPDVVANAFFALGLMVDSSSTMGIITRLRAGDSLSAGALAEAATALDRIADQASAQFINAVLTGSGEIASAREDLLLPTALLDAWRLGKLMPAQALVHYATDTSADLRWRSMYSLGRMGSPAAGRALLNGLRDQTPVVRETAARWLNRAFADSAHLAPPAVKTALARALTDDAAGVRVNAVGALASFADSTFAGVMVQLLSDGDPNVRVAAVAALGRLRSSIAARAIDQVFDRRDATWAMRATAMAALVRADTAALLRRAPVWLASADFRERILALDAWSAVALDGAASTKALADPDARVQAAALGAWQASKRDTAGLRVAARARLLAPNSNVRLAAIEAFSGFATVADLDALVGAWRVSLRDPDSDARIAIVSALAGLNRRTHDVMARLGGPGRRELLQRPIDPVVRAAADGSWPELAHTWGDKWPIQTGRTIDDYRSLARTYLLATDDPHVTIDVEGRGSIDIELLPHEAPLTVANFLRLVDRHYFDGDRWHRVVPNFVVQDGDPTGTGNGGPGWSIRDEINRERYTSPMLGMALSGPDTGGSQWFINLSVEPHLDGRYTIFGRVTGTYNGLFRVTQGDVIRSIHR